MENGTRNKKTNLETITKRPTTGTYIQFDDSVLLQYTYYTYIHTHA